MIRRCLIVCTVFLAVACSKKSGTPPPAVPDVPVSIVATDSTFTMPDTLHAGLNHIVFENRGQEIHECMFIRLPDGMTPDAYVSYVKNGVSFPPGALDCAGPGLTSPGERFEVWVPLEEGNYIVGCWMAGHMTKRPTVSFVVHGAPRTPVQPPREDVTIRMVDFQYEIVGKLKSGEQTIRWVNEGPSMHEVDIFRLDDGRTIDDVRAWFKDQELPPPGIVAGGSMDSHDLKRVTWVRYNFTPGRYVLWCDMPMVQDAPEDDPAAHVKHADAGMFKEVTID